MSAHPYKQLTAVSVRNIKKAGRYADGNGLHLIVDHNGAKRWVLRTVVHGRRRDMGLGGLKLVSLADARDLAEKYRKVARAGGDPFTTRSHASQQVPSFKEAAHAVYDQHKVKWKNKKHAQQWLHTLDQYVFPSMGKVPVDQVQTAHLLDALAPIWLTKPETAGRVKQRIGIILDWAKARGHRDGVNPVDGVSEGLPKQPTKEERVVHHAALPHSQIPAFLEKLRAHSVSEPIKLAFEFLILTAARTSEVLLAQWSEIDLHGKVWTVPASRMKTKRQHHVPLSSRCLEILEGARQIGGGSDYVFALPFSPAKPLSNMVFLMTLRRMGSEITAHGFRSSFRDWAADETSTPSLVCEAALAHKVKGVEGDYLRSDFFKKRIKLMAAWERHCCKASAKVIKIA